VTTPLVGTGDFTATITGIPSDIQLDLQAGVVIAANTTQSFGPYAMTEPSYAVSTDALFNVAATVANYAVTLRWLDPVTSALVASEKWYPTGTTSSPPVNSQLTVGRGPTKAAILVIQVTNGDPAQSMTLDFTLWQSSRTVTRDDWRGLALGGGYPFYTVPLAESRAGLLGWVTNQGIANTISFSWQAALYFGQAQLFYSMSSVTNVNLIVTVPFENRTSPFYPTLFSGPLTLLQNTLNLSLPRCPVVVTISNNSGGPVTVSWSLTIQEFAS
jgi:hypothetical protein